MKAAKNKHTTLQQICNLIPGHLVTSLAREYGVEERWRRFSPWSHVVAMIYAQLSHTLSLNDIVDSCHNHRGALDAIRHATPPSKNGLSYANMNRNADMMEALFWRMLSHIQNICPRFGIGHSYSGLPRRFRRAVYAVDSTTIQLVANHISWAKHRRRKAAVKIHLGLDLHTFLPKFVVVKEASTHDATMAKELCAPLADGEIVIFDKAYLDFNHLKTLDERGVFWVMRAKDNMQYRSVGQQVVKAKNILRDESVKLTIPKSRKEYPGSFRRIEAVVDINGEPTVMVFITNNRQWSPTSICDLYKSRWAIEVFFKQIKQTLQLADFLGNNESAVRWQVWSALLCYLLLRFIAHLGKWQGSFSRIFTLLRAILFDHLDIFSVMAACAQARGSPRRLADLRQSCLPGF
jgi:hypothetical protein